MTRFWITLQQGVDFVLTSFARMRGGEIFVPKIPSHANGRSRALPWRRRCRTRIVGIRPGEKLHEIMCPADSSHLTLEFPDHYVIKPAILFAGDFEFSRNQLSEQGSHVKPGFEYQSGKNPRFLSVDEIVGLN